MSLMDRNTLWSSGHDESVEVNQRALIDKVLARYSGEFTVFRELLQNSDDAASKAVEIRFESQEYLDNVKNGGGALSGPIDLKKPVHQWTFRNNGILFREEDWARLKKIAEGNPDEEKIGAFGVGFYSLFSVTEEPFVTSGDKWMGFYWKDKKDQLFARRGDLPESGKDDHYRPWTTFEMGLREAAPMPTAFDFIRFLTSSITFMAHMEQVTVWFDGHRIAKLTKEKGVSKVIQMPAGLKKGTEGGTMTMTGVKTTSLNITAEVVRLVYTGGSERKPPPRPAPAPKAPVQASFFSSLFSSLTSGPSTPLPLPSPTLEPVVQIDPMTPVSSHVILSVFSGEVTVTLGQKIILELHRSTKKNPPTKLKLELIYTGKDEYDASKKDEEDLFQKTGSLFQGLRADLEGIGSARVFIGHATGQTTGIGGHISGRFIPTVERESIDLVDRNVAIWNKELLYVAGLLSRIAYEIEMQHIKKLWDASAEGQGRPPRELQDWLNSRCLHALKFFSFHQSTPSAVVSQLTEAAFFNCSVDGSFSILSTAGVMDAKKIRRFDPAYSGFLKNIPVLADEIASNVGLMVDILRGRNMLRDISFVDVLQELRSRPLTEAEMTECLKWRIGLNTEGIRQQNLDQLRREFLEAAILSTTDEKGSDNLIPLSIIKTYHIPRNATAFLPTDVPFPLHTLPVTLSKQLKADAFYKLFGWTDLTIPQWVENLVSPSSPLPPHLDLTKDAEWAERFLNVLARAWPSLSKEQQAQVVALLQNRTCVPTKLGMKLPKEAYFLNAHIFSDLPIIALPKGTVVRGSLEKILLALGVQRHVDLQIVFGRMVRTGDWSMHDLIKYLVAVEDSLTELELRRLQETVAFTKEEPGDRPKVNGEADQAVVPPNPNKERYRARELYEPSNALRELGLPILDWGQGQKWKSSSEEARFMFKLGLKKHPDLKEVLNLAAGPDPKIRQASLKYLIEGLTTKYSHFDPTFWETIAFVPAQRPDGTKFLSKPLEVFTEREYATMGFATVDPQLVADWVTKLKLKPSPPINKILPVLKNSAPRDMTTARRWFELLATRLSDFTTSDLQYLSKTDFIPVPQNSAARTGAASVPADQKVVLRSPNQCYVSKDAANAFHSQLFTYVDFGAKANSFLMTCGVRNEPTVEELAQMLVANPRTFFNLAGGYETFLTELRRIGVNFHGVSASTRNQMRKTACVVASRRIPQTSPEKKAKTIKDDEEEEKKTEIDLIIPSQIAIVDDSTAYLMFDHVWTAPQEDIIEELYAALGSPTLSSIVHEEYKPGIEVRDSSRANQIRTLVLERLPLFLHERTHSKPIVSYDWLNKDGNFIVTEVGKLTLTRTLQFGQHKISKSQEVFAMTTRKGKGPVTMWLGANTNADYYEVANSLCRVILQQHRPNDSLLFMTILSTDLRALRRRGFNVDRVLRHQQAEREKQASREKQLRELQQTIEVGQPSSNQQLTRTGSFSSDQTSGPGKNGGLLSNLRQKLRGQQPPAALPISPPQPPGKGETPLLPPPPPPSLPGPIPGGFNGGMPGPQNPLASYGKGPNWNADQSVTPHANIERNVRTAIEACRAENQAAVRNDKNVAVVKEAVNEGYCDTTGAINLDLIGTMGAFKVFVASQGHSNAKVEVQNMLPVILRFGDQVLVPLIQLYGIPSRSVHIFHDWSGPLIAFNRQGSLFVNLRYYKAWHDQDVQNGNVTQAYTSWYFSLAHEIAHNLVHPHNSEHEFYFSTICEQHMVGLANLITSAEAVAQGRARAQQSQPVGW
ncbi:hypothetical protein M422DRAFT_783144 [Sphaerobolus stellatus SS14]|uniref:Sacsin/Nov domain-containing protein n=1 Tax=Sphaerobolus stellatus (strain SS14) TaxID=990650 RepID=A0A0C9UWB9_SPHS4|nr:hypothetical protein M422DRAFT_783144 [Sphaerobolus stellatus SS14]